MALDIGEAVRDGIDRVTARNGVLLMGAFVLVGIASTIVTQTVTAETVDVLTEIARQQGESFDPSRVGPTPLAVPLPLSVALVAALALALLVEALHIVAIRTFVSDERRVIPAEFARRHIAWVTLNGFVGGIVVAGLVILGLVFLILPGVFLYVAFFFVRQEIAVEDDNFVEAMAASWSVTAGNRIEVFVLVLVVVLIEIVAGSPSLAQQSFDPAAVVLVATIASSIAGVFAIGIGTRAYAQLRETEGESEAPNGEPESDDEVEDPYAGALGPEDLDPP